MDELRIKLIILGDYSVGKTALAARKNDNYFSNLYNTTIGVDFFAYKTYIREKPVKVHVWDTAGQEKFRFIVKSYFNGANGAILVYDITNRKSFEGLKYWLDELKRFEFDGKYTIVGCKCDLENHREVYRHEGENLARSLNGLFYECSAKDNTNIDLLFKELVEYIITKNNKQMNSEFEIGDNDVFTIDEELPIKKYACCNIL
jgi:small GTP-binding protein